MAENRRERDKRFYFSRGQLLLLAGGFILSSIIIFIVGMVVGKEIEGRKMVRPEPPLVKVPVPGAGSTAKSGGAKPNDLTFYSELSNAPGDPKSEGGGTKTTAKTADGEPRKSADAQQKGNGKENAKAAEEKSAGKPWSVQINSYPDQKSARDLVDRLKNKGYNAFVAEGEIKGKTWYRVRVGRFESRDDAASTERALKEKENFSKAFLTRK